MSSLNSISENLRLQQIYSALVSYGAESVVDNSVLGRAEAPHAAVGLPVARADPGAVTGDPDPDPARGARAPPT